MTRNEVLAQLKTWVNDFAMDSYDAQFIMSEIDADGMDIDTFADTVDGLGYPELAEKLYALAH